MDQRGIEMLAETDQQAVSFRQRRIRVRKILDGRFSFYENMIGIDNDAFRMLRLERV